MKHFTLTIITACTILLLISGQSGAALCQDSSAMTMASANSHLILAGVPVNTLPEPATLLILSAGALMTSRVKS